MHDQWCMTLGNGSFSVGERHDIRTLVAFQEHFFLQKKQKAYRNMLEASVNPNSFTPFSGLNLTTSHSADDIGTTCGP